MLQVGIALNASGMFLLQQFRRKKLQVGYFGFVHNAQVHMHKSTITCDRFRSDQASIGDLSRHAKTSSSQLDREAT